MKNSVEIHAGREVSLELVSALLLYQSRMGEVYATVHEIQNDPNSHGKKVIGPGIPASKASLASFGQAVSSATAYAGFVPERLLYTSANLLAWWTPAAIRTTWFADNDDLIGKRSGPAAHPAMVFVATPGEWFVFALADSARPTPATKLMHSPHMNVWVGGRICTGNVALPPALGAEAIAAYEDAFFRSHFTHPNDQNAVKHPGGMRGLWKAQLDKPDTQAMAAALKPTKESLAQAIERISTIHRSI